jgi:hypothetical protein
MGLMDRSYRLAPTDDSLKTLMPDRLRHSLFSYCQQCNMSVSKSQMFFSQGGKNVILPQKTHLLEPEK